LSQGHFDDALADTEQIVRLLPRYEAGYLGRGIVRHHRGEFREALADYNRAIRLRPQNDETLELKSRIQRDRGRIDEAIADVGRALAANPKSGKLLALRGDLYAEAGKRDEAIADYTAAIGVEDNDLQLLYRRANLLAQAGDAVRSLADVDQMAKDYPSEIDRNWIRGQLLMECKKHAEAAEAFGDSLTATPGVFDVLIARAEAYARLGKAKEALADNDAAIAAAPWSPEGYARRGGTHVLLKNYARAADDFRRAIEVNGEQVGGANDEAVSRELTDDASKHGETQLRKMLADRPAMAEFVKEGDALWTWTVRKFAGEDAGFPVDWNGEPVKGFEAHHGGPLSAEEHGMIAVNDIPESDDQSPGERFDDLWSSAVFELHDIDGTAGFAALNLAARNGEITKSECCRRLESLEVGAGNRTRQFYVTVYLPWAERAKLPATSPRNWQCDEWDDPSGDRSPTSHWSRHRCYYAAGYDLRLAESLVGQGRCNEAVVILEDVLDCEPILVASDVSRAWFFLGRCHEEARRTGQATEAYTHSLDLDPDDVQARIGRAWLHHAAGKSADAIGDFREGQRLLRQALEARPQDAQTTRYLAWTLATLPYDELRDGEEAVTLATRACEWTEWKDVYALQTLAAADAEAGEFDAAVKHQLQAVEAAPPFAQEAMRDVLQRYRDKMPYRDDRS
jgi:tetratricopeptide (TPR) repeat protein